MNLENLKFYQKLYGLSSSGKIKQWSVSVVSYDNYSEIIVDHGYIDGKIVSSSRKIEVGKNIGKKNQTTHAEQALSEAESLVAQKQDQQYVIDLAALKNPAQAEVPLPMLAHEYTKRKKYLKFPCYAQPKLNGVRCLIVKNNDQCKAYSRGGKQYITITSILNYCNLIMKNGDIFDGELFSTDLTFQEIVSCVKREEELDPNLSKLEYWVYDCVSEDDYADRYKYIKSIILNTFTPDIVFPIVLTECVDINSEEEIFDFQKIAIENGFEGTMLRNKTGSYVLKDRSSNLLKYKEFFEKEFKIVGGEEGDGLAKGQCTFVLQLSDDDNRTFKARCIGPNETREEQWLNLNNYISKSLTVRFQTYSDEGVPIFPVGVAIRDGAFVDGQFQPDM